uniref:Uncharacterized protein n=1 Tax=Lepeophtheirus salmonis TaxID=72036 RepID=A0A0K2VH73_LEPSM
MLIYNQVSTQLSPLKNHKSTDLLVIDIVCLVSKDNTFWRKKRKWNDFRPFRFSSILFSYGIITHAQNIEIGKLKPTLTKTIHQATQQNLLLISLAQKLKDSESGQD